MATAGGRSRPDTRWTLTQSQPGMPSDSTPHSEPLRALRPAGPSELDPGWVTFFNHPDRRREVQTLMALLKCEAWQAIIVHQSIVGHVSHVEIHGVDPEQEGPDWGPGAKPPTTEDTDD